MAWWATNHIISKRPFNLTNKINQQILKYVSHAKLIIIIYLFIGPQSSIHNRLSTRRSENVFVFQFLFHWISNGWFERTQFSKYYEITQKDLRFTIIQWSHWSSHNNWIFEHAFVMMIVWVFDTCTWRRWKR